jgi:hypothetical protein
VKRTGTHRRLRSCRGAKEMKERDYRVSIGKRRSPCEFQNYPDHFLFYFYYLPPMTSHLHHLIIIHSTINQDSDEHSLVII